MTDDSYMNLIARLRDAGFGVGEKLTAASKLIDMASEERRAKEIEVALEALNELMTLELTSDQRSRAHYYTGNAWYTLYRLTEAYTANAWAWELPSVEKTIIHMRLAIRSLSLCEDTKLGQREMLTNLGNAFDTVGRFIEANECWSKALAISPDFGMTLGNKGLGLVAYATHLYDQGQAGILLKEAHRLLSDALLCSLDKGAEATFRHCLETITIQSKPDCIEKPFSLNARSLGETPQEQAYRAWCLENRLFLNPLNDLGSHSIAAHDCLNCPPLTIRLKDGAFYQYPGFFSQMVQEYVSARYLYYDGLKDLEVHFSDRGVELINTLDYPVCCLRIEKQKLSFRAAYSILDKIAYFVNSYMALGPHKQRVYFKTLWYTNAERKKGLRAEFEGLRNLPMRGLFWLSKDLYDDNAEFKESIEPEAQAIAKIRNHAEHKCLRIHDDFWSPAAMPTEPLGRAFSDRLEYPVTRSEFAAKVLRMLQMARSALIYLALAVHEEEKGRALLRDPSIPIGKLPIDKINDEWKR